MLTIWGGVTSECNVHLNIWFGDALDLSKLCKWLVYGFVVSFLIVLTSPLEGEGVCYQIRMSEIAASAIKSYSANALYTWLYATTAIWRRGATQAVSLVEFTVNIPGRRAFGVSTPGSERALANRYMLNTDDQE